MVAGREGQNKQTVWGEHSSGGRKRRESSAGKGREDKGASWRREREKEGTRSGRERKKEREWKRGRE
jgi:hypothetical protein